MTQRIHHGSSDGLARVICTDLSDYGFLAPL